MHQLSNELNTPFDMAFDILASYRQILESTLRSGRMSEEDIEYIQRHFSIDRGLIFSIQRIYKMSDLPFSNFCSKMGYPESIQRGMRRGHDLDFRLYKHQEDAIHAIEAGEPTVVATGTGSGKTESFLIPILAHCMSSASPGIKAILLYPMNALANDQVIRLSAYMEESNLTFGIFTGETPSEEPENLPSEMPNRLWSRKKMCDSPPDILITNYVMLDRLLVDSRWRPIVKACQGTLKYVVLDEIHTYRGTKATHIRFLLTRLRKQTGASIHPIGASATISQQGGYLSGTQFDQDAIDDFLQKILGVDRCRLVSPTYNEPDYEVSPWPGAELLIDRNLGLSSLPEERCKLLGDILGRKVRVSEYWKQKSFWQSELGRELQSHPFLSELIKKLRIGALTYSETINLFQESSPGRNTHAQASETVRVWLNLLAILAEDFKGEKSVIDLRLHIFLLGLRGSLKRCLDCGNFHSGGFEICPECSQPLFFVDKNDISFCFAKLRGSQISPVMDPEENDNRKTFFVRIRKLGENETPDKSAIRIDLKDELTVGELPMDGFVLPYRYNEYGNYMFLYLAEQRLKEIKKRSVKLADAVHPRMHMRKIVLRILQQLQLGNRKLLGFIDNRERVSHDALALTDEFVSRFLEGLLNSIMPDKGTFLNLEEALTRLQSMVKDLFENRNLSPEECDALNEAEAWYFRMIGEPARYVQERSDLLILSSEIDCNELEREVLDIFVRERALNFDIKQAFDSPKYIRFQRHWADDIVQIYSDPMAKPDTRDEASCISLSADAQEYSDFVVHIGEKYGVPSISTNSDETEESTKSVGADLIHGALESLANNNILVRFREEAPYRYALRSKYALIRKSEVLDAYGTSYTSIRDKYFFLAANHSSELNQHVRLEVENKFRAGKLNLLLSTPTLEMGIDIGDLQHILLIGVPPMPSNYAQRSGRAGRRGNYSTVISFCSPDKDHDRYYYERPKAMIDGLINAPAIHEPTLEVAKKHLRALVIAEFPELLQEPKYDSEASSFKIPEKLIHNFSSITDSQLEAELADYLIQEFQNELHSFTEDAGQLHRLSLHSLYQSGFLPDYGFNREQVEVWDNDVYTKDTIKSSSAGKTSAGYLSVREPEYAYTKFAPGRSAFFATDVYRISAEGEYKPWKLSQDADSMAGVTIRAYSKILANRELGNARKDPGVQLYHRRLSFETSSEGHKFGEILDLNYDAHCNMRFVNMGYQDYDGSVPFTDNEENEFYLGYTFSRQALIFSFDRRAFTNVAGPLSFMSSFDRTLKDVYGLDESELRMIPNIEEGPEFDSGAEILTSFKFIVYDATGNGDLPFESAFGNFNRLLEVASDRLHSCPHCQDQGLDGCYYCLKSHETQYIAPYAKKSEALNVIDYLIGKSAFKPSVTPFQSSSGECASKLIFLQDGEGVIARDPDLGKHLRHSKGDAENVYKILAEAIRQFYPGGLEGLKIETNLEWLISNLNGTTKVRNGKYAFTELQYELLRCNQVWVGRPQR
jgi:superfamily II DNA/RNA helicase